MDFLQGLRVKAAREPAWDIGDKAWMHQWLLDEAHRAKTSAIEFKSDYAAQGLEITALYGGIAGKSLNPHWESNPCLPAGNSDGGQWTRVAGENSTCQTN